MNLSEIGVPDWTNEEVLVKLVNSSKEMLKVPRSAMPDVAMAYEEMLKRIKPEFNWYVRVNENGRLQIGIHHS